MSILVTGSSGHLGEALMRTLKARGREAVGLDRMAGAFTDAVGSIADRAFVRRCMKGARTVPSRGDAAQAARRDAPQRGIRRH